VNLALNILSLLVQLVGVRLLLKRLPLPWVLAILPLGLALGGAGIAITGALGAAIVTKAIDGSVRFSVHRTAAELLLVPLPENARRAAKSFADVLGQRGAQMIGSLLILACLALAVPERWLAVLLAASALLAVLGALRLRFDYIQLFKDFVTGRRRRTVGGFAHLDMASLEAVLTSLDSESEDEIIAALRVLDREGKAQVIPGSILYHPSEDVVVTALRIFALRGHRVTLHALGHLEHHASIRIRAEAIAARAVLSPDPEALALHLEEEKTPEVRAAIIATMAAFSMMPEDEARAALGEIVASGTAESRIVLAEVIGWRAARAFEPEILELTRARELEVRRAAISALGSLGGVTPARAVVDLLADPGLADDVHAAVVAAGPDGIAALESALADRDRSRAVRRLVPALLADIDPERAAAALLANLAPETDGMVRYRSILALAHILESRPDVHLDERLLEGEIRNTIARAYRYIDRRLILVRGAKEDASRATQGHALLVDLLRDKERNAVGRLFRLLALAYPYEEFDAIYSSIESGRSDHRANAMELIDNVLGEPLRDAILGLVDDVPDEERLQRGESFHRPLGLDYEAVVSHMLGSSSVVVRDFAAYHVGELGLASLRGRVQELMDGGRGTGDVARTLALLAGSKAVPPPSLRSNPPHVG
jgi:AAA family ATP:ADP antiporter